MASENSVNIGSFGTVDGKKEAAQFIKWLDWIEQLPQAVSLREISYEWLGPAAGDLTVDVGCGTGRSVFELAERGAQAIGVDLSEKMIGIARQRFPNLTFVWLQRRACPLKVAQSKGIVRRESISTCKIRRLRLPRRDES